MNPFMYGFQDELSKLALVGGLAKGISKFVIKRPWTALSGGLLAHAGVTGARQAAKSAPQRRILARPGRPTSAYYTNYHQLFKRKLSKPQQKALSKNFAKYRETT